MDGKRRVTQNVTLQCRRFNNTISRDIKSIQQALLAAVFLLFQINLVASNEMYEIVSPANTSECLEKVAALPLVTYELKHDSVAGRRQLGSIGPGLEHVIPESVQVLAKRTYPSPNKGEPLITLENTAVVDKAVIFMHNVGATQELARQNQRLWEQLGELEENNTRMDVIVADVERRMIEEADAQLLERKRIAEAEAEEARLATEIEHIRAEEHRKAMEAEAEQQNQALEHQTRVAKRKLLAEAEAERARKTESLRMEEDSSRRRETLRLATESELRAKRMELEREMDVAKAQMDVDRVKAEVQAKVDAEKENEDVALRKIRAQGEEDRKRVHETINVVLGHLASAVAGLAANPRRAFVMTAWLLGAAGGYLTIKEVTLLLRQVVESYLGRPGLVRETSRRSSLTAALYTARDFTLWVLASLCRRWRGGAKIRRPEREARGTSSRDEAVRAFQDVILPPDLKQQVLSLSVATRNAKRNGAAYRHLLLYGPPGTGKTMVAKRLAAYSNMDCAIMSGGDVGPLGKDAVTELHGLFRWAKKSSRGLLLFIDEAEAFLGKRSSPTMSEDTRNALNALLYNTGSASHRLMMVLATNRAEELDEAVLDRMDDSLFFPLPDRKACTRLLVQYFNHYCAPTRSVGKDGAARSKSKFGPRVLLEKMIAHFSGDSKMSLRIGKCVDDGLLTGLAAEVDGFSGREISKLMLAVQSCAFGSEETVLTADIVKRVITQKASEHRAKASMRATCSSR